jgi:exosortase/archaeosortase family protein
MTQNEWPSWVWARIAASTATSALVALFVAGSPALLQALAPLNVATAYVTVHALNWLGVPVQREAATLIHSNGFGYEIAFQCTGIVAAAMLAAAIFGADAPMTSRLRGAAVGTVFVLALNMTRLVSLFWIGVEFPAAFRVAHSFVCQGLTVLFVAGFFDVWRRRTLVASLGIRATLSLESSSQRI